MLNYHEELERIIKKNAEDGVKPKLLLHCCCAPCASYCLEFLAGKFEITCFFYNPNITDKTEYDHRLAELKRFVLSAKYGTFDVIDGGFSPEAFYENARGREDLPEGGERCFGCYSLRLERTAEMASKGGYDYFATTLTVSPHKNAGKLNELGFYFEGVTGTAYLPSDFKKKGGYKRSVELSNEYGLYRQNFCGCEYSARIAEKREKERL
jgi:predicted adenine nucleotide alpha hydrolase (AANH) superfamily ATPase